MTTFSTKNQAKRKYYYIAGILVVLLIIVSLAFNSFRKSDNCDPISGESTKSSSSEPNKQVKPEPLKYVTIETNSGQVRGQKTKFNNSTVNTFLGIPYAKPPVGALRFEQTAPVGQWTGVRDALQQPASCLQNDSPLVLSAFRFLNSTSNEDCLYLNVWSPAQEDQFLPVLVYIHGGAFAYGGVATEELDGLALAAQHNVVVITIQYRLGVFGFLSFESEEPKGNMGLYDQREALKWIHTNVNKFGGDQDLITVIGHGAGAVSAGLHMMTSDSKFFFQRAILQGFGLFWNKNLYSQSLKFSKKIAEDVNCQVPNIKDCIKKVNADRLLEVQQEILEDNPVAFGPRIPSEFAPNLPSESKDAFDFQVDFMFGINSEDDSLFISTYRNAADEGASDNGEESKEESEEPESSEEDEPVERSTAKPILTISTTTSSSTTTSTTTAAPEEEEKSEEEEEEREEEEKSEDEAAEEPTTSTPSSTTMASTSTTSATTTTTTTTTTPSTTTEKSPEPTEKETDEEPEKEDKEEDSEEGSDDGEGEGDDESTDEEKRRRRRKREIDDYEKEVLCPMLRFADNMVDSNRTVYVYQLNEFSSYHDEVVFAFGYPIKHKGLYDQEEIKFSKRVMKNWAQFATDGDLSETDELWKSYTKENPMFLKMSISSITADKFKANQCSAPINSQ